MTRKDYELLAGGFRMAINALDDPERIGAKLAATEIAHRLEGDNPRFDHERFLQACGFAPL
jgi:hypothetical protein